MVDLTKLSEKLYGVRAPRHVVRALRTAFPNVRLAWDPNLRAWCLFQRLWDGSWDADERTGRLRPFRTLGPGELPTLQNTVYLCQKWSSAVSRRERQRLLDEMEGTNPILQTKRRGEEAVSYHARELAKYVAMPTLRLQTNGLRDVLQRTGGSRPRARRRQGR